MPHIGGGENTKRRTRRAQRPQGTAEVTNCGLAADFYGTLNGRWWRDTTIPDTETRITQAYFIRERVNDELDRIIDRETGKMGGPLADFAASYRVAERTMVPTGFSPLLQLMLAIEGPVDVAARIGWMNRHGIASPLALYVQGDPRDHSRCRVFIEEGQPRIGIPEYWDWPEYTGHRKQYAAYVKRLAAITGLPALLQGFGAEREFAKVYPSALERRRRIDMYTWSELCTAFPHVDWRTMFEAWGLREPALSDLKYNVTSIPYLHHFQRRLTSWSSGRWAGWFALIAAQWMAGCSPHGPLRAAWFAYNRRFLQGMEADDTAAELRRAIVRAMMPNTLGKLWVREFCDPALKRRVGAMVERVRAAAAATLAKTTWMSPSTRAAAVRKIKAMDIQVGWPEPAVWKTYESPCGLSRNDYVGNLLSLAGMATQINLDLVTSRQGCRSPLGANWGRPVFEVNAFYYPDENRFLLPAAILRPPFYDTTKSTAMNYGAIGATIGHELCHAFDSEGRSYNENGDKRDWWTEHDDREYRKKAAKVVQLYESRDYRGMEVNGQLTLIENIADLGGLEFALAGLRSALGRSPTKGELREFFTAYAISWRAKDRRKRAAELLATDFHAPPMLRVNHAIRQMDEWYEAFGIGPECEEYIAPAQRIHFFT